MLKASTFHKHVALVKLRSIQSLDDSTVDGIVRTISQLKRLGLYCLIVLDCSQDNVKNAKEVRETALAQADRLASAFGREKSAKARCINDMFTVNPVAQNVVSTMPVRGSVEVQHRGLLIQPLSRGLIPVIVPVAHTSDYQQLQDVDADDIVLALTREFAGLNQRVNVQVKYTEPLDQNQEVEPTLADEFKLHRIILLDPLGGIPAPARQTRSHVFVNLEQEYEGIRRELLDLEPLSDNGAKHKGNEKQATKGKKQYSVFGASNPVSKFLETETNILSPSEKDESSLWNSKCADPSLERQLKNLDLLKRTLALLPPSCSALLTTPREAATFPSRDSGESAVGVGTRRARNPLIFNLLTDKPLISSSLPLARLESGGGDQSSVPAQSSFATLVKRGMPLTIIPDPGEQTWQAPRAGQEPMSLEDPRIDFPRLLNLIEDSFNRPLDVDHYLGRIKNKIAGIIVAGEYEGGAILTWELPPGAPDDGSESSRHRMVPYLDKFAVLKRSQGAGGVADMVFSAMVRSCLPDGVCWRSRKDNRVNSWYFERSEGVWKLPDSKWTMFWTTKDLTNDMQRWKDYEGVCRSILPSWADNKHIVD